MCYFMCRPDGNIFVAPAGTSEFAKRWQPKEGDIVSFKHRGLLMSGAPKCPTLFRLRKDITWEDVVHNWQDQRRTLGIWFIPYSGSYFSPYLGAVPAIRHPERMRVPKGYWLDQKNVRKFFFDYAESMRFDPLEPSNWTNIPFKFIVAKQVIHKSFIFSFFHSFFTDIELGMGTNQIL